MVANPEAALLVHYYFPPIHSIGVLRNFYLAQAFQKKIEHIQVLTTSNRNILPQNNMRGQDKFHTVELETKDYRTRAKKTHFKESQKDKFATKVARKIIDSYPFNVWIGEGGSSYIKNGIKQGTAFLEKHPTAFIYTSFRPYADMYIGYKLKQKFAQAKWVVDFRDLHVDPMYKNVFFPNYQNRNNKKLLKAADLVITVSDGLKEKLKTIHPKVITVYNGISIRETSSEKFSKFTISYTGSMFGNKRNPRLFFKWLREQVKNEKIALDDLSINYAGKDGNTFENYIKEYQLNAVFENRGLISHHQAKELQERSHVNLLLSSVTKDYKGVLTGKLFEYIGSLTPTIAVITGGEDQEMEKILKETASGIVFYQNRNDGAELLSWYQDWKKEINKVNDPSRIQKRFSWDYAAQQILSELND